MTVRGDRQELIVENLLGIFIKGVFGFPTYPIHLVSLDKATLVNNRGLFCSLD